MVNRDKGLWAELDRLGEAEVKKRLSLGIFNIQDAQIVEEWLSKTSNEGSRTYSVTVRPRLDRRKIKSC